MFRTFYPTMPSGQLQNAVNCRELHISCALFVVAKVRRARVGSVFRDHVDALYKPFSHVSSTLII